MRETAKKMLDRGWVLGLVAACVYLALAPSHIVDGDNAEFATLGTIGGTAHPSGYPLYLLWLRVMQWLPGTSPAHTAALATALLGAATIVVLHAACRAWGARPLAATVACALYAGAPLALRAATRAEVFELNCLIVAAVLWLAARGGPLKGARRVAALGLLAGLGLANHMTCTLVLPIGILGVVRGVDEARGRGMAIAVGVGGFVVGLLPYVYLLATPETPLSWGKVAGFDDLVAMVTRRDYGGPGAFARTGEEVPATMQFVALARTLGRAWLWAPIVLGAWAIYRGVLGRAPADGETRRAWWLFVISWMLAGPILVTRFNLEPEGFGLYVIERFHVLPMMLLVLPIAVGLSAVTPFACRTPLAAHVSAAIASTLLVLGGAGLSLRYLLRIHTPAVERFAQNTLRSLPRDAVVFAGQDDEYFGFQYVQWALRERQDVTVVAWQFTSMPWYRRRLEARGVPVPTGRLPVVPAVEAMLSAGRPVFFDLSRNTVTNVALSRSFPTYPYGTLMRVLPRGSTVPSIEAVYAETKMVFERFELDYSIPGNDDELATIIHNRYASTWNLIGRKLREVGKLEDAVRAFEVARVIGPQP